MGNPSNTNWDIWADESAQLGGMRAEFHWRNLIPFYGLCLTSAFCCSACTIEDSGFFFPIILIVSAIILSAGAWLFHMRVTVYENGLKVRTFLSSQVCLWTHIAQVFDVLDDEGKPSKLTIVHRNRYPIHIPTSIRNFPNLAQIIIQAFIMVNFEASMNMLQKGGVLASGRAMLDATHFEIDFKRLPLWRIETIYLERQGRIQLRVRDTNNELQWLSLSNYPIPNRHLLKKLVLALQAEIEKNPPADDEPDFISELEVEELDVDEPATD